MYTPSLRESRTKLVSVSFVCFGGQIELSRDGLHTVLSRQLRPSRLVRIEQSVGGVLHYEGESGAERLVCYELSFGGVIHFDGETGGADDCVASASRATRRHARVRPLDSLNAPEGCSRGVQYIGVHFTYSSMYTHVLLRS